MVSYKSWGFHYPLETYLSWVVNHLQEHSVLSCDVRKETGGLELLEQQFGEVMILSEESKHHRILAKKPKLKKSI